MGVNETCCNLKPIDSSTASQAIERASSRGPSLAFRSVETGSILENGPGGKKKMENPFFHRTVGNYFILSYRVG